MIRIYVYRCIWTPQRSKEEPYIASSSLVGYKLLFIKPHEFEYKTGFYSLYNDAMEIYGTQLILNKDLVINMENYDRDEWLFSNDIAMSGYRRYFNHENLAKDAILLESQVAEVLNARPQFTNSDKIMLLKY